MESNNLKLIWKIGVSEETKSYSDSELNEMIVKSAQRSMKAVQLGGIFQFIVIAVIIHLIATLLFRDDTLEIKLLNFTGLLFLAVCFVSWKRSDNKMNKYRCDIPVKEWLEYRINELSKTIYTRKKYNRLFMSLAFLLGFGFHIIHQIILKAPFNPILSVAIFVGLIIYFVIVTRSLNKKYRETLEKLEKLKKLYTRLEKHN